MTEQIQARLAQLRELTAKRDALNLDREAARKAAIPAEVAAELAVIDLEFAPALDEAEAKIAELTEQIKAAVAQHGATVKTEGVQAVYSKPKITWDARALDGYAMNHPELLVFRKEGKPSVSIRWS